MVREENVSTVTRSPDLPVRGQRSKKVKISKYLNVKNTSVDMFNRDRQTKVSMVTSSCAILNPLAKANNLTPCLRISDKFYFFTPAQNQYLPLSFKAHN